MSDGDATDADEGAGNPAAEAADALEPEAGLFDLVDPMAFGHALALVGVGLTRHPLDALLAGARYATDLVVAGAAVGARFLGSTLAWNDDSTRMPATMHSFYLRSCYVGDEFARGELELAGARLSPAAIEADLYVLAAEADHIAPWRSSFEAVLLFSSSAVRFVLTSSGHIAGIVNPPSPKSAHWTDGQPTSDPQHWLATATRSDGSSWEDWAAWIATRAGSRIEPPSLGSEMQPPLGDAPGEYVHEK
jgi:hypothetical protein